MSRCLWLALAMSILSGLADNTAIAQPCYAENDGPDFADLTCSSPFQNCILFTPPDDLVVTRIEVFTGETDGIHEVSLWAVAPMTGLPDYQISQGTWLADTVNQWQGADLDMAVSLTAGESYFFGWHPSGFCSQSSLLAFGTPGAMAQSFYWSPDGNPPWNGPYTDYYKFRLICDSTPVGTSFVRGDVNDDGTFDISDAVFALGALFVPGAPSAGCADAADANDDGTFDISDAVFSLGSLFVPGSPAPPAPVTCGVDPTADLLDCGAFGNCP